MSSLIRAQVSAAALRSNLARVREVAAGRRVMAIIKANAYGHGLVATARCLEGADAFGVARMEEAVAMRDAGINSPVVLLEGVFSSEQLALAAQLRFDLVVHEAEQLSLLEAAAVAQPLVAWLKVDTGMNRLGFRPEQFAGALARLAALPGVVREIRSLTHFACADERGSSMTLEQIARFTQLTQGRGLSTSLANSAAVFSQPRALGEWVRPGLALYGVAPFAGETGAALGLVPAMRLVSTVISLRDVSRGETVGYGATWRAERNSRIAIVAAGYGDGLLRSLCSGSPVMINGQALPLAGRVSMDMIGVDVTDAARAIRVGDQAMLWGPELPVEQVAQRAGTIPYELLCAISQRVPVSMA
ncbi:MAG: alanine racemase [Pseudomonadota bacterium]